MQAFGPFSYRVTQDQVVRAMQRLMLLRLWTGPARWLLGLILLLLPVAIVLDLLTRGTLSGMAIAVLAVLPIALLTIYFWAAPMMARRQFRQSAALRDEHQIAWDEEAITFTGTRGRVRMPFAEFHRWSEAGEVLMLYQTEMFFNLVPRTALGEAAQDLTARLENAGVKRI